MIFAKTDGRTDGRRKRESGKERQKGRGKIVGACVLRACVHEGGRERYEIPMLVVPAMAPLLKFSS